MIATVPFEPDAECYLFCCCTDCDGRIWDNLNDAEDHLDAIDGPGPVEIVLVNVGLN